jgi:PAS domain S-box-containing protein
VNHEGNGGVAEGEARYRVLIENSLTGMCVQQDQRLVYVNQRFADILDYDRNELLGQHIWDLVSSDHRELVKQRHFDRLAGKEPIQQYEFVAETRQGSRRHLSAWFSLITYRGRRGILGNVVDITNQKEIEEALKESEERFRTLFESAPDCVFIKDRTLRYSDVNPAMAELFDVPAERLIGKTDLDLFGRRVGLTLQQMDSRVLDGERLETEHTRSVRGVPITFYDIRVPLRNARNEIVGVYGIARDITDLRKTTPNPAPDTTGESFSPTMRTTLSMAATAAERDGMVLLLGESGVGKDHLARYIHDRSLRRDSPFFVMNCAALPAELAEAELFGHEPGAFTGAAGRKRGLLELAEGGTLLLNEIGDLPLPIQAKLLTFLDRRSFTRVGGERTIAVNARLLVATNRDLEADVRDGGFRRDLFYRINVLPIHIPPLRERKEDIPALVQSLLSRLAGEMQLPDAPAIDRAVMERLVAYPWPGNVRELRNVLERALMLWQGGPLDVQLNHVAAGSVVTGSRDPLAEHRTLPEVLEDVSRALCLQALERTGGNKKEAAVLLGISRNALYRNLRRLGLMFGSDT